MDGQEPASRAVVVVGAGAGVGEVRGCGGVEVDVAVDAGHPPLVLVFDVARVAPTDDLHGERVLSPATGGDVELARQPRVLRHAGETPVDVELVVALNASEMDDGSAAVPPLRERERGAVDARRVRFGHVRWGVFERHLHVRVDGPIAGILERPVRGDGDRTEPGLVGLCLENRRGYLVRTRIEPERPGAVERRVPVGARPVVRGGGGRIRVGDQARACRKPVDVRELGGFPGERRCGVRHAILVAAVSPNCRWPCAPP